MTLYSAFILVAGKVSCLARHLRYPLSRDIILEQGSHLSAKIILVFGTEYIQELVMDRDLERNPGFFEDMTEVKFITSLGGICAIQLLSID
jgi:hypothetical protein